MLSVHLSPRLSLRCQVNLEAAVREVAPWSPRRRLRRPRPGTGRRVPSAQPAARAGGAPHPTPQLAASACSPAQDPRGMALGEERGRPPTIYSTPLPSSAPTSASPAKILSSSLALRIRSEPGTGQSLEDDRCLYWQLWGTHLMGKHSPCSLYISLHD